jgi:hypothetical protein
MTRIGETIGGDPEGTITFTYLHGRQVQSHAQPKAKKSA